MSYMYTVSQTIRNALDARGVELTYDDTDAAAVAVLAALEDVFERAWIYDDLSDS